MSDIPKLHYLMDYINGRRGIGHTFTMLHGALNSKSAIVLAVDNQQAHEFIRRGVERERILLLENIPYGLSGRNNPIAIDNYVLTCLLREILEQNRMMRMQLNPSPFVGEKKKKKSRRKR